MTRRAFGVSARNRGCMSEACVLARARACVFFVSGYRVWGLDTLSRARVVKTKRKVLPLSPLLPGNARACEEAGRNEKIHGEGRCSSMVEINKLKRYPFAGGNTLLHAAIVSPAAVYSQARQGKGALVIWRGWVCSDNAYHP